jgi:hypothetical protein
MHCTDNAAYPGRQGLPNAMYTKQFFLCPPLYFISLDCDSMLFLYVSSVLAT